MGYLVTLNKNLIAKKLENHHVLFRLFWDYGSIVFDDAHPTAWVEFDKETGDYLQFKFNPKFWADSNDSTRQFVICHELLHIWLEHGKRTVGLKENRTLINIALDLVVNHTLVDEFQFERDEVQSWEKYAWLDTVFSKDQEVEEGRSFEYYLEKLKENSEEPSQQTVDYHNFGEEGDEDSEGNSGKGCGDDILDYFLPDLLEQLDDEEMESLRKIMDLAEGESGKESKLEEQVKAGKGSGRSSKLDVGRVKKKKKWESVIKKWEKKHIVSTEFAEDRWDRLDRRYYGMFAGKNFFLPSEQLLETSGFKEGKVLVFFFLDTSGSCYGFKERFVKAAKSLDPKKFDVRTFCFDTRTQEVDLKKNEFYGGGGTSFHILENTIQQIVKKEKIKYPKAVWIITDGYGDNVNPEFSERWSWFITDGNYSTTSYIPKKSKIYHLKNFE